MRYLFHQDSGKYQPLAMKYLAERAGKVKPGERKRFVQCIAYLHALVSLMKVRLADRIECIPCNHTRMRLSYSVCGFTVLYYFTYVS